MKLTQLPKGEKPNRAFKIKLNGEEAETFSARVSAIPFNCTWPGHQRPLEQTEETAFLSFAMNAPVHLSLTASESFCKATVRPLNEGIKPTVSGRTVSFTVTHPGQYTVELDGSHRVLHIFADPETAFSVDPTAPDVIYYPAGVHEAGVIELKNNQTLYLERGAVVYGAVLAINTENVRILGEGVLDSSHEIRDNESMLVPRDMERRDHEGALPISEELEIAGTSVLENAEQYREFLKHWNMLYGCIHLYGCKNAEISGLVLRDAPGFAVVLANCENCRCDNLKIIGNWRYNSDGIDLFNCQNCIIHGCFLRCFDDCIVLKGIPGWDTKGMENIIVENCVVWCDWGASLEIGAETVAPHYVNILFRNCDLIHNCHAAMRIHHCDRAEISMVTYENIRVEYSEHDLLPVYQHSEEQVFLPQKGHAALMHILFEGEIYFSCEHRKGSVDMIRYRDIKVLTEPLWRSSVATFSVPAIRFEGYGDKHRARDIRIEGLFLNGIRLTDPAVLSLGDFVENVRLK